MAGLTAARALHSGGADVLVLEESERVGGRVLSSEFHGRVIECGAQFPSTGYRHIPKLIAAHELSDCIEIASPWAGYEREGRLCRVHQRRLTSLVSSGLLHWREGASMVCGALGQVGRRARVDRSNYAAFAKFDDEDAHAWSQRTMGRGATEYVLAPSIHGFYFHSLRGSSKALLTAVLGFYGSEALAVRGGWGQLPRRMATGLTVHRGARVEFLREQSAGWLVRCGGETLQADWVVLAVPAPRARELVGMALPLEQEVMSAGYSATVHLALGLRPGWAPPPDLVGLHGLLLSPSVAGLGRGMVAAMVMESARLLVAGAPEVITLMLTHTVAQSHAAGPDSALVRLAVEWLDSHWPGIADQVVSHRVQRWQHAEPLSPVGRARSLARYRRHLPCERRLVLCGDYMGLPWTDGAAETGLWAAARIQTLATSRH